MHCPYCLHQDHLELDLHADGYGGVLVECAECGALLASKGKAMETVHGPMKSFEVMVAVRG